MKKPYKLVQVNMNNETLEKLHDMKEKMHADTITNTIKSSVDIADIVTTALSKGKNVVIEEKNGDKYRILVPGIKHG